MSAPASVTNWPLTLSYELYWEKWWHQTESQELQHPNSQPTHKNSMDTFVKSADKIQQESEKTDPTGE